MICFFGTLKKKRVLKYGERESNVLFQKRRCIFSTKIRPRSHLYIILIILICIIINLNNCIDKLLEYPIKVNNYDKIRIVEIIKTNIVQ